ncbi:MAG TPA: ABC transporter permease [Thermoanaerobaculia bacterium]|nr:ABC transporter permease [Thermoanaerobaculia bacterium]
MIRNSAMNLRRDRAALVLTFVLPIAFFSIFAGVFGARGDSRTPRIRLIVVDEDRSDHSAALVAALGKESGLNVMKETADKRAPVTAYDRASAEAAVKAGRAPVAIVIPKGFGESAFAFSSTNRPRMLLLADSSDPIAPQMVTGLLQKVAMTSSPTTMAEAGIGEVDRWSGGLTAEQKGRLAAGLDRMRRDSAAGTGSAVSGALIEVDVRDILGESKKAPLIAFYAAGTGVMFLLFSASSAGGTLLEESESGTLDRLLSTRVTMTTLLLGKLLFLTIVGVVQLTVMFLWGAAVFGLELFSHLGGFYVVTIATALAASAFGLLLASVCRTRAQLGALSTLVILIISALGGSMFPRFLMPEAVQRFSLIAFNSWALEGYLKVFWREEPTARLWPEVAVLVGTAILFTFIARRVARKWEIT